MSSVLHRVVDQQPLSIVRAKGSYLYTEDGRAILDACGGAAVISIGHGHEDVISALTDQMNKVTYVHSGEFSNDAAEQLAEKLAKSSGMAKEATESTLKLVRQYFVEKGQPERVNFIARQQSYHGNTLGALGLSRHTARREPFLPILNHDSFHYVSPCLPYHYKAQGETDAAYVARLALELEQKIQALGADTVAGFFAETVGGATAGCTVAPAGYYQAIKDVCEKYGVLLVLDEIMCGVGRTGKMHAWQWEGVTPDVQTLGKGLGGGYAPISAILVSEKVVSAFQQGAGSFFSGFTYQSHALGCRAALEVLRVIEGDDLIETCRLRGLFLEKLLHETFDEHPFVGEIRGRGLFWALDFVLEKTKKTTFPVLMPVGKEILGHCLENGIVVYPGKGTVDGLRGDHIIIAPPYNVTEGELRQIVQAIAAAIDGVLGSHHRVD